MSGYASINASGFLQVYTHTLNKTEAKAFLAELTKLVAGMPEDVQAGEIFTDQEGRIYIASYVPAYEDPVLWCISGAQWERAYGSRKYWETKEGKVFKQVHAPSGSIIKINTTK